MLIHFDLPQQKTPRRVCKTLETENLAPVRRTSRMHLRTRSGRAQIGSRNPVVPSKPVFIPPRPQKPRKASASGQHVPQTPQQQLPRRRRCTRKTRHLQTPEHHPRRRPPKHGKQREILQVHNRERRHIDHRRQLAERELPTQRTEQSQKPAIRKQQASPINHPRNSPIFQRSDGVQPVMLRPPLARRILLGFGARRHRNVNDHPPVALVVRRRISANSDRERKVVIRGNTRLRNRNAPPFLGRLPKRKSRLRRVQRGRASPHTILLDSLAKFTRPRDILLAIVNALG